MTSVLQGQHEMGMGMGEKKKPGEMRAWHDLEDNCWDDCFGL